MKNVSFCGIDCLVCPIYKATVENNFEQREKLAKEYSSADYPVLPSDIDCCGCHNGGIKECSNKRMPPVLDWPAHRVRDLVPSGSRKQRIKQVNSCTQ